MSNNWDLSSLTHSLAHASIEATNYIAQKCPELCQAISLGGQEASQVMSQAVGGVTNLGQGIART